MSLCITSSRKVEFTVPIQRPVWELRASVPGTPDEIIRQMQESGKLPATLTQKTVDAMKSSLKRYFSKLSSDKIQEAADKAREIVEQTLKTEESAGTETGLGTSAARGELGSFLESMTGANVAETMNMDFFIRIAQEVATGAGNFITMNSDQTRVNEFPAVELVRVYSRRVPRGTSGREGDDDWETRWENAGGELVDGRMVALKDDPIWEALGSDDEYDDVLGNPFPPFAFNSGMWVDDVDRADAEDLGLLEKGEKAEAADFDLASLFATAA